jgi:hypothetical protein
VQDRDGAEPLLRQARRLFPFVERIIGDAGYQGPKMATATALSCCPSAGLSSAPSAGSAATGDWPATSNGTVASLPPSSAWPYPHHAQTPRSKALRMNQNFPDRF